ncbi:MAG TPA: non-canonical purine NTP pyrophosphatase [Verrucomicrobiae bacterium]|jgi:XTP/dITP diphosphohydrolase
MTTLIIATRNAHKVEEIRGILGVEFQFLTLRDFPRAPEIVEDAPTFEGNATKKAVELARWLSTIHLPLAASSASVLADDSGLEVDALNAAPGVHSARFAALDSGAAGNSSDAENNAKLLRLLANVPEEKRSARFRCVIALTPVHGGATHSSSPVCLADEREFQTELFGGSCEGQIRCAPSGGGGFGYDPLFVPDGFTQSFAELGSDVKNRISHRAKALEKLRARLRAV